MYWNVSVNLELLIFLMSTCKRLITPYRFTMNRFIPGPPLLKAPQRLCTKPKLKQQPQGWAESRHRSCYSGHNVCTEFLNRFMASSRSSTTASMNSPMHKQPGLSQAAQAHLQRKHRTSSYTTPSGCLRSEEDHNDHCQATAAKAFQAIPDAAHFIISLASCTPAELAARVRSVTRCFAALS